jgi:hypothetical protein
MRYLTDGTNLYEIAAQRTVQISGPGAALSATSSSRDCITEATAAIDDLQLAALFEVR